MPEGEWPIASFDVTRAHLIVHTLEHATSRVSIWSQDGVRVRDLPLDPFVSLLGVSPVADPASDRFGYTVDSFTRPAVAYVGDAATGVSEVVARLQGPTGSDPGVYCKAPPSNVCRCKPALDTVSSEIGNPNRPAKPP